MKVGIVTINNGENYGNRLQNYALQEALIGLGCDVETIRNITGQTPINYSNIKWKIKEEVLKLYLKTNQNNIFTLNKMFRHIKFKDFTDNFIKQSNFIISKNNIPRDLSSKYDYFIAGSDQVWNPNFFFNSDIEFLTFANKNQRISYAASFGISEISIDKKEQYRIWLEGMTNISIREESGAKIVKELIGKETEVVIDPTMLLEKKKWISISRKPKMKLDKKFILTYFLGGIESKVKERLDNISKKYDLQIINLLDKSDKVIYSLDPAEFIWLINKCELMCTDSFHGAVFSLILKKPFIVFERKSIGGSMNSRLETLLSKFDMESRLDKNIDNDDQVFSCDFTNVDTIINYEREKSLKYLRRALNIK